MTAVVVPVPLSLDDQLSGGGYGRGKFPDAKEIIFDVVEVDARYFSNSPELTITNTGPTMGLSEAELITLLTRKPSYGSESADAELGPEWLRPSAYSLVDVAQALERLKKAWLQFGSQHGSMVESVSNLVTIAVIKLRVVDN